jgi:hypothetical protein
MNDVDNKILQDYLRSYRECFEAMNDLLNSVLKRIELTDEEIELAKISDMKYKNMIYHIRKWIPNFKIK